MKPWQFLMLSTSSALLAGCVGGGGYNDLGGGYGEGFGTGLLPDSASHSAILYSSRTWRRVHVWPSLPSGYGPALVHDDLIVFHVRWPDSQPPGGLPAFFAAKSGPPAVEITKAVRATMAASMKDVSPSDLDCSLQNAGLWPANSGVCIKFFPVQRGRVDSDWREVVITWPQISGLVSRIRATGMSRHFKGVRYYTEN
jgi:hypothetical protein